MTRTLSLLAALALAACSRSSVSTPRYAVDIFAEDTLAAHITVRVTGDMQMSLNGAGYYTIKDQPIVLTPASLVVRGTGSATIASVDSMQTISIVPAGTHPDSTDSAAIIGRILRLSRAEGQSTYKVEVTRP